MIRLAGALGFCLLCTLAARGGNEKIVAEDSSAVYQNDKRALHEKPLFFLKTGDRVTLMADSSDNAHIMASDGRTGYLERKRLKDPGGRTALSMEEIKVIGWLDNPEPVYILDFENGEYKPIRMSRNFAMDPELMKNVDKETFERENEIYYYKDYPSKAINGK